MTLSRIFKRIIEMVTKPFFINLLLWAYRNPKSFSHRIVAKWAAKYYGLAKMLFPGLISWQMDFVLQAQVDYFRKKTKVAFQGIAPIGFEQLKIEWSSNDANSSIVYLYGFSDNLTYFDIYKKHVKPGTLVLDVGANIGMHSLVLSTCTGPQGKVIAFEPSEKIFCRLQKNIALNTVSNIQQIQAAVAEKSGKGNFDTNDGDFNIGKGSIKSAGQTGIVITTIDEIVHEHQQPVSLIKIDTEGHEISVLRGARKTLERWKPVIVCEVRSESGILEEFMQTIPYPADFFKIPVNYYESLEPITAKSTVCQDVLVVPK